MQVLVVTVSSYGKVFCHMSEGLKKSNEAKLLVDELSGSLHKIQVAPFLSGTQTFSSKQHQELQNCPVQGGLCSHVDNHQIKRALSFLPLKFHYGLRQSPSSRSSNLLSQRLLYCEDSEDLGL